MLHDLHKCKPGLRCMLAAVVDVIETNGVEAGRQPQPQLVQRAMAGGRLAAPQHLQLTPLLPPPPELFAQLVAMGLAISVGDVSDELVPYQLAPCTPACSKAGATDSPTGG